MNYTEAAIHHRYYLFISALSRKYQLWPDTYTVNVNTWVPDRRIRVDHLLILSLNFIFADTLITFWKEENYKVAFSYETLIKLILVCFEPLSFIKQSLRKLSYKEKMSTQRASLN